MPSPAPAQRSIELVTKVNTGSPNWTSERFAALQEQGITGDVARAIVAHWAFETDWGRGEWNYNVGNIVALGGQKGVELFDSKGQSVGVYRAYDTLSEAVASYLSLIRGSRYADCWAHLQVNPQSSTWVRCLGAKGYYTAPVEQYAKGYEADLARLPKPPPVSGPEPEPADISVTRAAADVVDDVAGDEDNGVIAPETLARVRVDTQPDGDEASEPLALDEEEPA